MSNNVFRANIKVSVALTAPSGEEKVVEETFTDVALSERSIAALESHSKSLNLYYIECADGVKVAVVST